MGAMTGRSHPAAGYGPRTTTPLLTYGASTDRTLGLARNCRRARRALVRRVQRHPDSPIDAFDFEVETGRDRRQRKRRPRPRAAALCDTGRAGRLRRTAHAPRSCSRAVRQVVLLGRRGLQAAFTIKLLRVTKRAGATMSLGGADAFAEEVMQFAAKERARKRLVELMAKALSEVDDVPP